MINLLQTLKRTLPEAEVKAAIANGAWLPLLLQHASRALNSFIYMDSTHQVQKSLEEEALQIFRDGILVQAKNGGIGSNFIV